MTKISEDIYAAIGAAWEGGQEIMDVYDSDFAVEHKADDSPLTMADKRAHRAICAKLEPLGMPILSEEGRAIPFSERSGWKRFWMVDPLDGTKEFVKRNGEFTVNIAVIEHGRPAGGVIYVPVKKDLYFGWVGGGAYKVAGYQYRASDTLAQIIEAAEVLPRAVAKSRYTVVGSRSHMSPETEALFQKLKEEHGDLEVVSMGSSLKICLVAEGVADIYPRFAPTMEWDTAAGHAIALAAGKDIIDHKEDAPMRYNKENLLNNWFVVA